MATETSSSLPVRTATRATLAAAVHQRLGLAQSDSRRIVDDIFTLLEDALVCGKSVKIKAFGTFRVRKKVARIGRNPKTGAEVRISPRRVVSFRPSPSLRASLRSKTL